LRDLELDYDDALLRSFHRDVLAPSFSSDELDDVETLARALRGEGDTELLTTVAVADDGTVLGGVVGETYVREGVLLLSYLAVRPGLRGLGVGTELMEHVASRWYARPAVRLALAEVHDPRSWSGVEGDAPLRRLRLYERLGARVLGVPFVQPALSSDRARVPGFLLLAFHVDPSVELAQGSHSAVRSDLVGSFVRRYFESVEGARPPYDPQLAQLLRQIEEPSSIRLLPIGEYDRVPPLAAGESP
jgi:GNAT superfamily N-acetyltransferase